MFCSCTIAWSQGRSTALLNSLVMFHPLSWSLLKPCDVNTESHKAELVFTWFQHKRLTYVSQC